MKNITLKRIQRYSREGDRCKLPALKPMHSGGVDGSGLFGRDIGSVLQIGVLALLLGLQIQTGETAEVLLDDGLVHSRAATNTLAVIMCNPEMASRRDGDQLRSP